MESCTLCYSLRRSVPSVNNNSSPPAQPRTCTATLLRTLQFLDGVGKSHAAYRTERGVSTRHAEESRSRATDQDFSSDGNITDGRQQLSSRAAAVPTAAEHERRLRRRLQACGPRPSEIRRLKDVLVTHLLSVAGNPSYRTSRQSVLVSGSSLVHELRKSFQCKRLIISRQSKGVNLDACAHLAEGDTPVSPTVSNVCNSLSAANESVHGPAGHGVETHFVTDRILRKIAGLHSYDGGCVAEMRHPPPAASFGDMKLLLCLGRPPNSFCETDTACSSFKGLEEDRDNFERLMLGILGTILRSAAALQWQGVWLLPQCPDVFNPLAIRASQGALFWLPYRRGSWDDFVKFTSEQDLLICIPHEAGLDVHSSELSPRSYKGVCLLIDDAAFHAADALVQQSRGKLSNQSKEVVSSNAGDTANHVLIPKGGRNRVPRLSCPYQTIALPSVGSGGDDGDQENVMALMHPVTSTTILMYQLKQTHFPSVASSAFLFSKKTET
ncbi:TrmH family RNA methyltransferase [Toxoplasma gondii RUB]|uniref:TrmH family RNA methyltransferase n=1 Tax=Toxoplasma gondii RUB TaxID=935652 RepID=A0A086LZ50_TOXGO|nr:TrmH family RNA methyltransferase [Toxoplasma gondii RUB]